jgi:hypothetical protein
MSRKTLSEVYGYSKPQKKAMKLSSGGLRSVILSEIRSVLSEADDDADVPASGGDAEIPAAYKSPKGTAMAGGDNIAKADATEIVAQLMSGDSKMPIFAAIGDFHNPEFTPGIPKASTPEGAEAIAAWAKGLGPDFLKQNIEKVQTALPSGGKSKDAMPALEPSDVAHVKDALSPGGQINVDIDGKMANDIEDVEEWHQQHGSDAKLGAAEKEESTKESRHSLANILFEDKFPQGHKGGMSGAPVKGEKETVDLNAIKDLALSFLTKGLKAYDQEGGDDAIEVKENEPIKVASMIPTQSNVLLGKSLAFAIGGGFGGQELGAYITGGNEILDGHHRWAGTMIVDPGAGIKGHKVMAPAADILPVLTTLGNALGRQQKGMEHEGKNESLQRWHKLAGLL